MPFEIRYSEQEILGGKPPKRYELKNLSKEQAYKTIAFLREPLEGVLIKFSLYENNHLVGTGDNRPV